MNTLTENFKSAQAELVMKDKQLRVKEQRFQEVTGELEVAQEKMFVKEEALKKREAELATAKVKSIFIFTDCAVTQANVAHFTEIKNLSMIQILQRLPSLRPSRSWRRRRRC